MRCRLLKPLAKTRIAWLLLALGIVMSAGLGYLTARDLRSELQLAFQRNVDDTAIAIEARLRAYTEVLHGVRGLFAGSEQVSAEDFENYVASLDLVARYPGIQAISFYPRVPGDGKETFERAARALGGQHREFSIAPPGERAEYYPILFRTRFIEGSPLLLGSDQMAEAARRTGIELARDSGALTVTAPLENWNGNAGEIGVVLRLPVYRRGAPVATREERREAVIGVVGAAFKVRDLIDSVARARAPAQLSLSIHDAGRIGGTEARSPRLLYAEGGAADADPPGRGLSGWLAAPLERTVREVGFGGRQWRIIFTPGAEAQSFTVFHALPLMIYVGGVFASLLVFALMRSLAQSGQRAQGLAESMVRKLTASQRRIAETEKFSAVMVVHSDLEGRILKAPPTFCRLLGCAEEGLLGSHFREVTHPEDIEATRRARARLLRGELKSVEIEKRYARRDGAIVWVVINMTLVVDDDGAPVHFRSYVLDITDRKRSEDELQRLYNELEQRVEQRTADLQTANRELEAFSYSVSHDLRAPARHIAGYVRILQQSAPGRLTESDRRYLSQIAGAARRMGRLIDDLLGFSRTSRTELRLARVEMKEAAGRALDELAPEMARRSIRVLVTEIPAATADPALLHQVWVNLLSNAVKYTAPRPEATIEIGALAGDGREAVYFVRDNGVGLDMKHAGKLFGVFQRLHPAAEFEGTGIGLALVQRIVSRHGGRVWADGEVDRGATFYFTLPRAA